MKTAQDLINEWKENNDTGAELNLYGFDELPELPASLETLSANSATTLPELPSSLRYLYADSADNKPE